MRLRTPKTQGEPKAPRERASAPPRQGNGARRLMKRAAQVALVLGFVGVLVGGWAYHGARAQISEGLMDLGAHMMLYAEARHQDAPRDLVINGQVLRFSSGTTGHTTREVLDHFEARCAEVDGALMEQMSELRDAHPEIQRELPAAPPSLREEDALRGYVTCLDMGPDAVPLGELMERIRRYGATGDVSAIGDLRFVFAEQMGEGEERSTHFVGMWTTGSFDVRRMFPSEGDAPGDDVPGLGRPPATRRVLSGFERGQPQHITVYETRRTESELASFYQGALERDGWTRLEHPEAILDPSSPRALVAEREDRMITVVFHTNPQTGAASAAVFDAR